MPNTSPEQEALVRRFRELNCVKMLRLEYPNDAKEIEAFLVQEVSRAKDEATIEGIEDGIQHERTRIICKIESMKSDSEFENERDTTLDAVLNSPREPEELCSCEYPLVEGDMQGILSNCQNCGKKLPE